MRLNNNQRGQLWGLSDRDYNPPHLGCSLKPKTLAKFCSAIKDARSDKMSVGEHQFPPQSPDEARNGATSLGAMRRRIQRNQCGSDSRINLHSPSRTPTPAAAAAQFSFRHHPNQRELNEKKKPRWGIRLRRPPPAQLMPHARHRGS